MKPDYSLYLVTDNTKAILGDRDIVSIVRAAVEGGITVVQLRDKTSETADLIRIAHELHEVTQEHGIPLIINDRADVALAVGAEGLHIGQDDMDLATARRLLGNEAIIGVTASSVEEALIAAEGGADYLGIGTINATPTKENTKSIIGTAGAREILTALATSSNPSIATVAIGGINATNLQRILYQSSPQEPAHHLSGIALVSAIMAAPDPKSTSSHILNLLRTSLPFAPTPTPPTTPLSSLLPQIPRLLARLSTSTPLCHNITNLVVQNFAANVALAIGGSPIMSANGAEAADLAALKGSLVLNMGTVTPDALSHYTQATAAYNAAGGPILLDPVGAGATAARRAAVAHLLRTTYFSIIKGNASEIETVLGSSGPKSTSTPQRGVDSSSTLSTHERAMLAKTLATRERCVVILTGAVDVLSDGYRTLAVRNGHAYLGAITGSGCTLGTAVAAFAAVERGDVLLAALAGCVIFELASERAARREDVKGPGTFVPAFLDELFALRGEADAGNEKWISEAKVEVVEV